MASYASYSDMLVQARTQLPMCPDNLILQQLGRAARDLCIQTEAWYQALTAVNTVASTAAYVLTLPTSAELRRVREVYLRTSTEVTNGQKGTLQDPTTYEISIATAAPTLTFLYGYIPTTSVTSGLLVYASLAPLPYEDVIPDDLLNQWGETILSRALAILQAMPKKPWTDTQAAGFNLMEADRGFAQARFELTRLRRFGSIHAVGRLWWL